MDTFGSMGTGGLLGMLQRQFNPTAAAPQVPADGAMQPTIGPGAAAPPATAPYQPKFGLPKGGILSLLQGQSPQGLMGILNNMRGQPGAAPLAGAMPQAGMLPGIPGSPQEGPMAPPQAAPQLPTDINPMNQF